MKRFLFSLLLIFSFHLFISSASASCTDLSKALVIGNGSKKVIEFTDPDCPFCRRASAYFHNRRDVTRYVFFNPLAMHQHARQKVLYILSGKDKARLYHEVMSGGIDNLDSNKLPVNQAGVKLLEEQQAESRKSSIDSTPTFMIMGRIVEGFDLPKIEALLGK